MAGTPFRFPNHIPEQHDESVTCLPESRPIAPREFLRINWCPEVHWFMDLAEARKTIESWREFFDRVRPHSSPKDPTPEEFAAPFRGQVIANPFRLWGC
jgi:transposase InsO family protein